MTDQTGPGPAYADPIQAPGTDEATWRAWDGWDALPDFRLPAAGRVVVVAAHPDDEVLGVGGTIARLIGSGVAVTVVSVTDGERSHAGSAVITAPDLARARAVELRAALTELGGAEVIRLQVPDTEVGRREPEVTAALGSVLPGAALCLAPWIADVHSDHEAAGRAAITAAMAANVPCWMYPVWMWHWARPDDPRVPWESASRVSLPDTVLARKKAAVDCFTTQIKPLGPAPQDAAILPADELAHHLRHVEVVFQ